MTKSDFGSTPRQRKYWGKGIVSESAKRKNSVEYHPYTEIGFKFIDQNGVDIMKRRKELENNL